ncbi:MAG TPA: AbrB family transcriptional regulator [Synergistales bacterium]|nr:AbrB family transcriptional regulator [Synergistales bacterium]HQO82474.1 AbrB family transcriptional regulator [Synergistales bacterium]
MGNVVTVVSTSLKQCPGPRSRAKEVQKFRTGGAGLTLFIAVTGGVLFYMLRIPVGGFVGSMVFTAAAAGLGFPVCPLPLALRHAGQLGLGALIGLNATPETVSTLAEMFLTILGTTAAMLGWGIILAFIVQRVTRWNLMTCLLATCPGGITQLASISEDLGADPLKVSLLHMVRLFTIFVVLPPLIKVLL